MLNISHLAKTPEGLDGVSMDFINNKHVLDALPLDLKHVSLLVPFLDLLGVCFSMSGVNNTHSTFDQNGKRESMAILIVMFLY